MKSEFINNIFNNLPLDLNSVGTYSNAVMDHSDFWENVTDFKIKVEPRKNLEFNGYKYTGPGDLIIDIYSSEDFILNVFDVDYMYAIKNVIFPWLKESYLKYLGFDLFKDFADIIVNIHTTDGEVTDYYDKYDEITPNAQWESKYWVKQ